jgi:hypothetical protein
MALRVPKAAKGDLDGDKYCTATKNSNEIIDLGVNISLIANSLVKDTALH